MAELFKRRARVTIGDRQIEGARVQFKVTKTLSVEPNTLELSIYNLAEGSRAAAKVAGTPIILEAGYDSTLGRIFSGDLRTGVNSHTDANWVTKINCGDGERAYRTARTLESFAPGTSVKDVVARLVKDMGLDPGNALEKLKAHDYKGAISAFDGGLTVAGRSSGSLEGALGAAGLSYSIQDGAIQVVDKDETIGEAVLISPASGLVGSPEVGEQGIIKIKTLLLPGTRPGARIELESADLSGSFRVSKIVHTGDTHGADWYSDLEASPL